MQALAMMQKGVEGEVLFEFHRIGNSVKVTAIHVATDTEAVTIGPANLGEHSLKLAALRKLSYLMEQKRG